MVGDLLRMGACSMVATPGDTDGNLAKIKAWTQRAVAEKVEVLLFPERNPGTGPRSGS